MLIEAMTMIEFEEHLKKSQTIVVPVGSVEEHGPHLPLSTDTVHVYEVCRQACEKTGAFLAPPFITGSAGVPVNTRERSVSPAIP